MFDKIACFFVLYVCMVIVFFVLLFLRSIFLGVHVPRVCWFNAHLPSAFHIFSLVDWDGFRRPSMLMFFTSECYCLVSSFPAVVCFLFLSEFLFWFVGFPHTGPVYGMYLQSTCLSHVHDPVDGVLLTIVRMDKGNFAPVWDG